MQLQAKNFKCGLTVNKWSDVKCSDVEWIDVILFWSEVSYGEVLGDKGTMYISVNI